MIALQLSGVDIGRKVQLTWTLKRKNAKHHVERVVISRITHRASTDAIEVYTNKFAYLYLPFYAEVEYLDD